MRLATVLVTILAAAAAAASSAAPQEDWRSLVGLTEYGAQSTCFLSGERSSGLNKVCYYSCPSGDAAITIRATELCPLSIKR